ncbi:Zinc finger BED domain-containing protein DAYSLEEPER [Cardamine amara subsp. amara]|uniref:Zinc finger BED domain-containing protein DAYSLEEPER n=1 Tax=Cardamine amara subsp. amara TaxID=228776 RepID=A0ABD1C588_CARAN
MTSLPISYCYNTLDPSTSKSNLAHVRSKMYERNTSNITSTTSQVPRENIPCGYNGFYSYYSQKTGVGIGKSPQDTYLDEPVLDMVTFRSLNVVAYWKDNSSRFKELASMACDVLSIPFTTVASESCFSLGSRVLNKYISSLLPINVQALICARNWVRGFQEIVEEFEFIEEGEKGSEIQRTATVF